MDTARYVRQLSLEENLQVIDHSPDRYRWGYSGSGPAQLAAAILNEVTDDPELAHTYYQLFKFDHATKREGSTFEISELSDNVFKRETYHFVLKCSKIDTYGSTTRESFQRGTCRRFSKVFQESQVYVLVLRNGTTARNGPDGTNSSECQYRFRENVSA